jgi:2-hydroxy-6-oxonona-2,4-dienedioate hydrolase
MSYKYRYLEVDNLHIRYLTTQSRGSPVMLVHGLGGSIESWINTIELLSSNQLKLIAIDLPGFGYSSKPKINYTINFYSAFMTKFIKKLNLESSLFLVGSSLGGHIAAQVAIDHPRLISKLVLISPAGIPPFSFKTTPALRNYVRILKAKSIADVKMALAAVDKSQVKEAYAKTILDRLSKPNAKEAFLSALRGSTNATRLTKRLHKIKADTLLIWGKDDQLIPVRYSIPFIGMKNCRMVLLEKCGHRPHVERPELFSKLLIDFFRE